MICDMCKQDKQDVNVRVYGGMSNNYCGECNKKVTSRNALLTIIITVVVLYLTYLIIF